VRSVNTILETGYNPQWYVKPWRRFVRRTQAKVDRTECRLLRAAVRAQVRATRWQKSQYYLATAARDVYRASRLNEDIVVALLITAFCIGYISVSSAANILYFMSEAIMNVTGMAGLAIVPVLMLAMAGTGLLVVWSVTAMVAACMQALMQSMTRKLYRSLRENLAFGFRNGLRMIGAWLTTLSIAFVPVGALGMLYAAGFLFQPLPFETLIATLPYAIIAMLTWLLYCSMHYALVPVVALFEPHLSTKQAIARSHALPLKRGRLFLLALHFALVGVLAALFGLAWLINLVLPIGLLEFMLLSSFGVLLGYYGVLTVFYRKRRLARS
jgi:hypothetical protein